MRRFIRFEQLQYQYPFQTKYSQPEQTKDHNENFCSPSQLPSSLILNPCLQVHPKEPIVFEQYELRSQLELCVIHSSISKKIRGNQLTCSLTQQIVHSPPLLHSILKI